MPSSSPTSSPPTSPDRGDGALIRALHLLSRAAGLAALAAALAAPAVAQNTSTLGENGWFSDDTRADGTGAQAAGTNLISPTLTADPEAAASGDPAHDADILSQIQFGPATGGVPSGTVTGAVHLTLGPAAAGKSQISHRKDDGVGHATGASAFGPGMTAEYSWMGDGTPSVTASLKFGVKTSDFGATGTSSRTGENAWDKVLIYEPGNLNGGTSDGLWHTETIDYTTGLWWFFDRTEGAGTIGTPLTLADMSTSPVVFSGSKTIADVHALITAPGAHVTSAQLGIGSVNPGGSVRVNQIETSFYRPGSITTFGPGRIKVTAFAPSSNTDPGVWFESFLSGSGAASIVDLTGAGGDLEDNQPIPTGAVLLTTASDNQDRANVGVGENYGAPADIFPTLRLEYSYHKASNGTQNLFAAPALKLSIYNPTCDDPGSAGDCFGTLVFEPTWNQPGLEGTTVHTPLDEWQSCEIDGDNGLFWWTGGFGQPNGAGGPPLRTLNEWLTVTSSDFADAALFLVEIGVGSYNQNQVGYFDDVVIAHGFGAGFSRSYDFDLSRTGELALSVASCQDDVDPSPGYQVAVELDMRALSEGASGFVAFLEYDLGVFAYRGDLSNYTGAPFPVHASPILQADDGRLELAGSVPSEDPPATADALLATLVFDVLTGCDPVTPPIAFEVNGAQPSELILDGASVDTTLTPAGPFTLDDTPPVLSPCASLMFPADASIANGCSGAFVEFTGLTATDDCDPSPAVTCVPPSGSFFPVGTTQVTCTATDACGNQSSCKFQVTVTPTNVVSVEVELLAVTTPVTRCIRFTGDNCSSVAASLAFFDHDGLPATPVRALAEIELPCGPYTSLCAKDEQHTKWETVTLSLSGRKYVTDSPLVLVGGDTDNDGDLDVNDLTLFLFQYGTPALPGGCPWALTRDADFDDSGEVGSEDHSFLTANWRTTSSCACTASATSVPGDLLPPDRKRVASPMEQAVDFHPDGWIDDKDVEVFERRNGLPLTLSKRMRERR